MAGIILSVSFSIRLTREKKRLSHHIKKNEKTEITELQKNQNKELSSRRIAVEHLICRLKIFRIASERFGMNRNTYIQVIKTISGLVRL
ncbi:MAG: transposase family protein [Nostoc sp.]|uniref:transposase family protein n=1 Tax=Nostoc sp. TaxID=1180 RepID=UPI002FF280EB